MAKELPIEDCIRAAIMSFIRNQLAFACAPRLRSYLEDQLKGSDREFVRRYLPQKWVFVTETETASIGIDESWMILVPSNSLSDPDIVVTWNDRALESVLLEPSSRKRVQLGDVPLVYAPTEKGKAVFGRLAHCFDLNPGVDRPNQDSEEDEDEFA